MVHGFAAVYRLWRKYFIPIEKASVSCVASFNVAYHSILMKLAAQLGIYIFV